MLQSMTGYGKEILQLPTKKVTIEIKSLNSKNIDLNTRIPQHYREKELEIRKLLAEKLQRGKVDFGLYTEITGGETPSSINKAVVRAYMQQLGDIAPASEEKLLELALKMPDTMTNDLGELNQEEWKQIQLQMDRALGHLETFRSQEGRVLEEDFNQRIQTIRLLLKKVEEQDKNRLGALREKLNKALADLTIEVDQNRFEQELIYYLEKYDITEEKVRLANHLDYFAKTMHSDESNGKKLGFIAQEIGREINTIGSKANYAPLQQIVVQMKDELEKIKEQLLNVL